MKKIFEEKSKKEYLFPIRKFLDYFNWSSIKLNSLDGVKLRLKYRGLTPGV